MTPEEEGTPVGDVRDLVEALLYRVSRLETDVHRILDRLYRIEKDEILRSR